MIVFRTDQVPPRIDKPHICADQRTIIFHTPLGNRIGWAEEGHAFAVAEAVLAHQRRAASIPMTREKQAHPDRTVWVLRNERGAATFTRSGVLSPVLFVPITSVDRHELAQPGEQREYIEALPCEFCDGKPAFCDGSSLTGHRFPEDDDGIYAALEGWLP